MIIASRLEPDKFGYEILGEGYFDGSSGNRTFSGRILKFDTYGDGLTKHSPGHVAQLNDIMDICWSVAQAIVNDPMAPEWRRLATEINRSTTREQIKFCLSVEFKDDGKTRFYSMTEQKVSASESKRFDRRWTRVEPWHGKPESVIGMIYGQQRLEWITFLGVSERIREVYQEETGSYIGWTTVPGLVNDKLPDGWESAWNAFRAALNGIAQLNQAKNQLENLESMRDYARAEAEKALASGGTV